jgi:hypothetical protein
MDISGALLVALMFVGLFSITIGNSWVNPLAVTSIQGFQGAKIQH